jgi:phosphoribosylformylglycinamidine (FGAM) synthase PurS component
MEIVQVNQAEMLQAINRSEVDMQISTAKAYPRDVQAAIKRIEDLASLDRETAEDCFYVLRRGGAAGQTTIEGLSVRMAEIIAGAWGNLRVQARIIGNDGKTITAQAVCHDLETNFAVSVEVKRRITDKNGKTYSEDMQVVTGNAACAIAFRNAVLKVVPKAITKKAINNIKQVALGKAIDLETSRQNCIANFAKVGVTTEMLCQYLDIKSVEEIGKEQIFELRATWNAIKEGTTSVQETFIQPQEEKRIAEKAKSKAQGAKERAQQAIARQKQNNATDNDLKLNNEQ